MRKSGIDIKEEWMKPETFTFKIPSRILESLGINKLNTSFNLDSSNNTFSKSPISAAIIKRPATSKTT